MDTTSLSADVKLAMISQPMNGLTSEEIEAARKKATGILEALGYVIVNTYFKEDLDRKGTESGIKNIPVAFLAKSLESMSKVDAVYFCKGWEHARGCKIEHDVCQEYHIQVFED